MAMTEAQKKAVPRSMRGVPSKSGTGSYPMGSRKQAGEAEALAAMHHGRNSAFTKNMRAKAHKLYPSMGKGKMKKLSDLS